MLFGKWQSQMAILTCFAAWQQQQVHFQAMDLQLLPLDWTIRCQYSWIQIVCYNYNFICLWSILCLWRWRSSLFLSFQTSFMWRKCTIIEYVWWWMASSIPSLVVVRMGQLRALQVQVKKTYIESCNTINVLIMFFLQVTMEKRRHRSSIVLTAFGWTLLVMYLWLTWEGILCARLIRLKSLPDMLVINTALYRLDSEGWIFTCKCVGTYTAGSSASANEGGKATAAPLNLPERVVGDSAGGIYVSDTG